MSWVEKIGTQLIIVTGDSKSFTPLWKSPMMAVEYNLSEFEFPNIEGALVDRRKPKARRYNLDIYFQGEDNIDQAKAFEFSSRDPRPWTVTHPIYGKITVQPVGLNINYTPINVSAITGSMIETIVEDNPKIVSNPVDVIEQMHLAYEEAATGNTVESIIVRPALNETTYNTTQDMSDFNSANYEANSKLLSDAEQSNEYLNLFNQAQSAILDITQEPLIALQAVNNFINFVPRNSFIPVRTRIKAIGDQLNAMFVASEAITDRLGKVLFEKNAGVLVSALALAVILTDPNSYKTKKDVINTIDATVGFFNGFILALNNLKSNTSNSQNSYMPGATTIINLNNLMNYTLSNLFSIASGAKQERSIYLENDSNIILLAHRFYGLDADDVNVNYLMESNGWGSKQILIIRKGDLVLYYV